MIWGLKNGNTRRGTNGGFGTDNGRAESSGVMRFPFFLFRISKFLREGQRIARIADPILKREE